MNLLIYIILGIIQGFTEPIPVSSSGHLFLFKNIFNTSMFNDLNFEIFANFGSFLAILFIFRKDVLELINAFFKYLIIKKTRKKYLSKFKYCLYIIVSTIPVGITGLLFKSMVENKFQNIKFLGSAFFITSIMLFLIRKKNGIKEDKDINFKDSFIIGLIQIFTILPGISRSGTVLVACLLCNFKRSTALKYTFILYFPISIATMVLGIKDIIQSESINTLLTPYLCGLTTSFIVTYFTYGWLSKLVKNGKLAKFSLYCLLLSLFIFIYFR